MRSEKEIRDRIAEYEREIANWTDRQPMYVAEFADYGRNLLKWVLGER